MKKEIEYKIKTIPSLTLTWHRAVISCTLYYLLAHSLYHLIFSPLQTVGVFLKDRDLMDLLNDPLLVEATCAIDDAR